MADITSTSNSRVKLARKLRRKRHRDRTGLCLLEGLRLIQDAWDAGAAFDTLFVTEEMERAGEGAALLASVRAGSVPVFTVSGDVLAAMAETVTPQGIVALVHLPPTDLSRYAPPAACHLVLLLDGLRDPGNAGTLLRSAAAAGADLVVFGPGTVDPFNEKVLRAGMGAHFRLPLLVCQTWEEVLDLLDGHALYAADAAGSLPYDQVAWWQPSVLIVGSEAAGLSGEARRLATSIVIPMQRSTESVNAAVAGSVILFEAARQRRVEDRPEG